MSSFPKRIVPAEPTGGAFVTSFLTSLLPANIEHGDMEPTDGDCEGPTYVPQPYMFEPTTSTSKSTTEDEIGLDPTHAVDSASSDSTVVDDVREW